MCVVVALAIPALPVLAQIPDVPGWQLSWHDEFDGSSLNTTNWTALNRLDSFNNEKQYYSSGQVSVANGSLQLTATNQPVRNKAYGSGLITSNALYGPGRFEARIDLPTTQGMWPAFWLNPNQVQWPLGGEIDVMENRGSEPTTVSSAFHWQQDP
ncbi:MAG TPA: glycoside hydrolase family 16 protein, partial [Pirellulales bacterium]